MRFPSQYPEGTKYLPGERPAMIFALIVIAVLVCVALY